MRPHTRGDRSLVIADGPFAETKEQILGMVVAAPRDLDQAVRAAAQILPPAPAGSR